MEDSSTLPANIHRFVLDESYTRLAPKDPANSPSKEGHDLGYYECKCPCCRRMRQQGFNIARMQINGAFDIIEKKMNILQEKLIKEVTFAQGLLGELTEAHEHIQYLENIQRMLDADIDKHIKVIKRLENQPKIDIE